MATTELFVVIIILVWNLAVLYLPFEKKQRARLSFISIAVLIVFCLLNNGKSNAPKPSICQQIAWNKAHHPETAKAMMAAFNISEDELTNNIKKPTPIEGMVFIVLTLALLTPLLINVVVMEKEDDNVTKKGFQLIFALNVVASALLLSLYYGLELTIIPWIKKSEMRKLFPITSKEPST